MHNMTKLEDIQLNLVCGGISNIVPDIAMFVIISIMGLFVCSVEAADASRYDDYDEEEEESGSATIISLTKDKLVIEESFEDEYEEYYEKITFKRIK